MLLIENSHVDPYFNLALEEYLLTNMAEEWLMLWRNRPSIIVGRNQNTLAEINGEFVNRHHLAVVRRLSGGGAVYHDLGNVNFTIVTNDRRLSFNFPFFAARIIDVLRELGVEASHEGRNDLVIAGRKFSGSAQCVRANRLLHHGTLLFATDLADLAEALIVQQEKIQSKGIKSVASRVANISAYLRQPLSVLEFKDAVDRRLSEHYAGIRPYKLTAADLKAVTGLRDGKYATWDWNYGNSPAYNFHAKRRFPGGLVEIFADVDQGRIRTVKIFGDFFGEQEIAGLEQAIAGVRHERGQVREVLLKVGLERYLFNISVAEFVEAFF